MFSTQEVKVREGLTGKGQPSYKYCKKVGMGRPWNTGLGTWRFWKTVSRQERAAELQEVGELLMGKWRSQMQLTMFLKKGGHLIPENEHKSPEKVQDGRDQSM